MVTRCMRGNVSFQAKRSPTQVAQKSWCDARPIIPVLCAEVYLVPSVVVLSLCHEHDSSTRRCLLMFTSGHFETPDLLNDRRSATLHVTHVLRDRTARIPVESIMLDPRGPVLQYF